MDCRFRHHTLLGTYGVADLQALSPSDMLATSLQGSFLHLAKANGVRKHSILSFYWKHVIYVHTVLLNVLCCGSFQT